MDCEQIAHGTYSPLTGFMDLKTVKNVLDTNRLPNGTPWALPVILQINSFSAKNIRSGERVALADPKGVIYAFLDKAKVEKFDPSPFLEKWFGTNSEKHPGVEEILNSGEYLLSGDVTLVRTRETPYRHYQLTPAQSRFIFTHKGWSRVVAFHTRNVIHRAH